MELFLIASNLSMVGIFSIQRIHKAVYVVLCQDMSLKPGVQRQVLSVRFSNENTPGIIIDFCPKFSLEQLSQL